MIEIRLFSKKVFSEIETSPYHNPVLQYRRQTQMPLTKNMKTGTQYVSIQGQFWTDWIDVPTVMETSVNHSEESNE